VPRENVQNSLCFRHGQAKLGSKALGRGKRMRKRKPHRSGPGLRKTEATPLPPQFIPRDADSKSVGDADTDSSIDLQRAIGGDSPHEILERMVKGDPLGVEERCHRILRERALLIQPERLALRSMAKIAVFGFTRRGQSFPTTVIDSIIESAITDLIREDSEQERAGLPSSGEMYGQVSGALGIEPGLARRTCVVFNSMPFLSRRVFWATLVERSSIEFVSSQLGISTEDVVIHLKQTLKTLSLLQFTDSGEGGFSNDE
jgi:hypothetical protein